MPPAGAAPPPAAKPAAAPKATAAPKAPPIVSVPLPRPHIPADPIQKAQQQAGQHDPGAGARRAQTVLRRQTILRSLGLYKGAIDGQWGAQSQAAWSEYVRRRRTGQQLDAPFLTAQQLVGQEHAQQKASNLERVRAAAAAAKAAVPAVRADIVKAQALAKSDVANSLQVDRQAAAARAATAQLAADGRDHVAAMGRFRADPTRAAGVDLHRLAAVVTDPRSGFDPTKPADVKVVQTWLGSHGHAVPATGVWDKATTEALQTAMHQAQASDQARAVHTVVTRFYGTEGLVPGTRPSWWTLPGPVPQPAELTRILQGGGFAADTLFRTLYANADLPHTDFATWRTQQLKTILGRLDRGFPSAHGALAIPSTDALRLSQILSSAGTQISPKAQAELSGELGALMNARDMTEFKRTISTAVFTADRAYTAAQAARAKGHASWWGKAAHAAIAPGEFLRTAAVADLYMGIDFSRSVISSDSSFLAGGGFTPVGLAHSQAAYWQGAKLGIADSPTVLRLAFTFMDDPLIFARPFRLGSTIIRYGLRAPLLDLAKLGTYRLVEREGAGLLARRVVYDEGTWHLPIKAAGGTFLRSIPGMNKALALKDVAIDTANSSVMLAARHAFAGPRKLFPQLDEVPTYKVGSDAAKLAADSRQQLAAAIPERLGPVWDALVQAKASLYVDAHRITESSIGASLIARYAEEIRVQEIHRLASNSARDVYERAMTGGATRAEREALMAKHGVTVVNGELTAAKPGAVEAFTNAYGKLANGTIRPADQAAELGHEEYKRVKDGAGLFIKGAGDPEITHQIDKRVAALLDQFKEVLLPSIQHALEDHYAVAGTDLWDDTGLWAARGGEAAAALKEAGFDAFAFDRLIRVANPLGGKELDFEQYLAISSSEIRRAQARIMGWAERATAAGRGPTDDQLRLMLDQARRDVEQSFILGNSSPQVAINHAEVRRLAKELDVPENIDVEVKVEPGSNEYGHYDPVSRSITISVDPERDLAFGEEFNAGVKGAFREGGAGFMADVYHVTVAHELRHAFQQIHWDAAAFDDLHLPYETRPTEIDAHSFGDERRFDPRRLVRVVNPRGGAYVDARGFLDVPEIYAREFPAAAIANEAVSYDGIAALADTGTGLGAPLSKFDETLGQLVWDLGSMHSDAVINHITGGVDPSARRFGASYAASQDDNGFRQLVQQHHIALAQGTDRALPYALNQNQAFMVAFAHAQSWPLRVLHNMVSGTMDAWIFATLPLRPGWVVRNVVDNMNKTFVSGVRDPRAYMTPLAEGPVGQFAARHAETIFEAGVGQAYEAVRFLDGLFGTDVARPFKALMDTFWMHTGETLQRVFNMHGWNVPAEVLDQARFNPFERPIGATRLTKSGLFDTEIESLSPEYQSLYKKHLAADTHGRFKGFRDGIWHAMANVPENYFKKVIYNDTMDKLTAEGVSAIDAHMEAWAKVEATLFDYSHITVAEENLRVFFPFIQFWRKNTGFWARSFATKPWLPVQLNQYEQQLNQSHKDWPSWMRRYVDVQEITDATAKVPGLSWIAEHGGLTGMQFDPLSFVSFGPYLRAFKSINGNLPPDEQGSRFFGPLIDAMNDFGLSPSPFFRKPLESLHIASTRAWQSVFPQTPLAVALTSKFFGDTSKLADWERVFTLWQGEAPSDEIAKNFEFYVRREMTGQAARGETPDRAKAEATIRTFFLSQNAWGYFMGIYGRKNTPEDFYMAKLTDDLVTGERGYSSLTAREKQLNAMWNRGGIDSATGRFRLDKLHFDDYVANLPLVEAYYKQPSYAAGQAYLQQHPDLVQYVDPLFTKGRAFSVSYLKSAAMYMKGAEWFDVNELMTKIGLSYQTRHAAATALITPALKDFWAKNDTPADIRRSMLQAEMHRHLNELNQHYFAIPASDHAARDGFAAEHPEMVAAWQNNNSAADDYKAIHNNALGDLRSAYFHIVETKGFQAAGDFLKQYRFMFEGTSAAKRIDEQTGTWIPADPAKARAYLAAKRGLTTFFDLMHDRGKGAAYAWLNQRSPDAALAQDYFREWSNSNTRDSAAHGADWLKNKAALTTYWNLAPADRDAYLKADTPVARSLRDYFAKWSHPSGSTAHARAWLAARDALHAYFALPKEKRGAWLRGGSNLAHQAETYFKLYGSTAKFERAFRAANPALAVTDPELQQRLTFWHNYFALTPADRPAYVNAQAEAHGVFVYGAIGEQDWHEREAKFVRAAMAASYGGGHPSEKKATYLYVKPLLDALYAIPKDDQPLFIKANPELADYLDRFANHTSLTGNKHTDALIREYFALPEGSPARYTLLASQPAIQSYFDKHSTPAERAIRATVNTYFSLSGHARALFNEQHPEIQVYFDQRKRAKAASQAELEAFDRADPRLRPFFDSSLASQDLSAAHVANLLRQAHYNRYTPDSLTERRDRQPQKRPDTTKPHKAP